LQEIVKSAFGRSLVIGVSTQLASENKILIKLYPIGNNKEDKKNFQKSRRIVDGLYSNQERITKSVDRDSIKKGKIKPA
jgi:hypothetical protein